ncbi:MAG: transporter, family, fosmidomycin resistance protein [Clostridia bacterium]|nr:transporter, family, fosmidomycin resistance protein [Clostridia bacterium]
MQKLILYLLSFGHAVTDVNQGVLPILLPFFQDKFGLSYFLTSAIVTLSNISSSIIQPLFGYWSDKRQIRWLLPSGCLLAGLGMAAAGYATNYYLLLAAVFISGVGVASYHPEASKSAHFVSGPMQASSMSIFSVGGNIGIGLGPIFANFILNHGGLKSTWMLFVPTAATVILLIKILPWLDRAITTKSHSKKKHNNDNKTQNIKSPLAAISLLILVVAMRSWLQNGLTVYIPMYYMDYLHGDETFASTMLSIFLVSGAIGTLIGGRLADYWGAKKMIIATMILITPLVLIFPYVQGALIVPLLALSGFLLVSTFAPAVVLAQSYMPEHVGMASGLSLGFAIGFGGLGLMLLGSIADAHGVPFVLRLIAVIPAITAGLAFFLPNQQQEVAIKANR